MVDGTKVGFSHQLLMVAICYRRRTIPLAWTWVRAKRGHSSSRKQIALLGYVRALLPQRARVVVVGYTEFGATDLLRQLDRWHWGWAIPCANIPTGSFRLISTAPGNVWIVC